MDAPRNRPNPTKPQQFEKNTKHTGDWQAKHILSEHTSTDIIREAAGVDIRFWKALAQGGGGGKLGIISTCPIACQLAR